MATNTHTIHHFHIAYNTLCLPPSSSVSLGDDCNTQKNLKTLVIRCEFFRGQTMYIMGNVKTVNNNSAFLLNPNHSMFTNLASRVCPFSNPPNPRSPPPLKSLKVTWDESPQYMGQHVPNQQPDCKPIEYGKICPFSALKPLPLWRFAT